MPNQWVYLFVASMEYLTKEKGEKYICRKDVVMDDGETAFTRGTVYLAENNAQLPNDYGSKKHNIPKGKWTYKHFLHLPK